MPASADDDERVIGELLHLLVDLTVFTACYLLVLLFLDRSLVAGPLRVVRRRVPHRSSPPVHVPTSGKD